MSADIQPSSDLRITKAFSTPIGIRRLSESAGLNEDLARIVLAAEKGSPSVGRSNVGGWRSRHDLFDWPEPGVKTLYAAVQEAVNQMIGATVGEQGFRGYLKIHGWANVLRRENYNVLHAHPESAWSGVYYVDAGSETAAYPLSGLLELRDPRPGVEMCPAPGWPFGNPIHIRPETGMMVLFPSWLYHHVHPYHGEKARIAIAFNVPAHHEAPPSSLG